MKPTDKEIEEAARALYLLAWEGEICHTVSSCIFAAKAALEAVYKVREVGTNSIPREEGASSLEKEFIIHMSEDEFMRDVYPGLSSDKQQKVNNTVRGDRFIIYNMSLTYKAGGAND